MDCRVIGHPKAGRFQSYYGVPLLADDGQLVGTVCHFDEAPVTLEPAISVVLNEIAPFVTDLVSRNT
jgi:GAF domain-containing protein